MKAATTTALAAVAEVSLRALHDSLYLVCQVAVAVSGAVAATSAADAAAASVAAGAAVAAGSGTIAAPSGLA